MVALRCRSYLGQPGSPVVARATQAACILIYDRLIGQQVDGHLSPAVRIRAHIDFSLQLLLGRQQTIERNRSNRLVGRLDPKLLGEVLGDAPRGCGARHVTRRPALDDGTPEQPLCARHR